MCVRLLIKCKVLNRYKVLLLDSSITNIHLYLVYMSFLREVITYTQTSMYFNIILQHNAFALDPLLYWNNKD